MDDSHISIDIDVKDGVSGPARVIITSLDDIGDKAQKAAPKVEALDAAVDEVGDDAAKTAARLTALERKVKTLGNESVKTMTKMGALQAAVTRLGQKTAVAGGSGGIFDRLFHGSKSGGGKRGGFVAMGFAVKFMRFFKLIMIPTIFDAVGAVSTLASSFGAMASAAIGGLSPIIGLLGAIPSLMAAAVQGVATLKLGFSGLGDAIKVLNDPEASPEELSKALSALGPKTQILAKRLADLQKPFANVKKAIGNDLAPGFIQLTNVARSYLPLLRKSLTETAKTISGMAGRMSNFMRSAGARSDLGNIMGANNTILKKLGSTVVPVFKALLNVMRAATPMVIRFVDEFASFVKMIAASTGDRKALRDFFEKTYTVTKGLIKVVADLSMAFFNIFKQGASWGGEMGQSIMDLTAKFRNWTETAEGQQKITQWFEQMKPIVNEVAGIVVALAKGLASVSMDKTLVTTLQTIRTDTVPAIVALLQGTSGKFIEPLSRIIGTIASIMVEFKAFPTILETIAKTLEVIAGFIQGLPGPIKQLLGYMVTFGSLLKFGGMLGFLNIFGGGSGGKGMLAAGLSNTVYMFKQVVAGAGSAGDAFRLLGSSAKSALTPLLTKAGWIGVAVGVASLGLAISSNIRKWDEMKKSADELLDTLNEGFTSDSIVAMQDQTKQAYDMWQKTLSDYRNPIKSIFSTTMWTDLWTEMFTVDPKSYEKQQAVYDTLIGVQNKYYGAVQQMMNSTGEGSLEYWNEVAVAAGVNGTMGVKQMIQAMTSYDNVNRRAAPAVREMYHAIKSIGDASVDSANKADAFGTVLTGLQAIFTGGGVRDQKIAVKRNWEGVESGLNKMKFNLKLTAKANWEANDALKNQAATITELASAEYARTGDANKATAAYERQYDMLKNKILKAMPEGIKNADAKAQKLLDKFMVAPKYLKRALNDPNLLKMIESGKYSYDELRKYIKSHPLNPTVKIKNKFKKGKLGIGGMGDVSQQVRTESVAVRVKGERKVENTIDSMTRDLLGLEARPYTPQIDDTSVTSAERSVDSLFNKVQRLGELGVGINVDVSTAPEGRERGGPVFAGQRYLVGEAGPEAFVSKGGAVKMIGLHGQEYRTFGSDGVVIPNHALAETVPAGGRRSPYSDGDGSATYAVNIGTINAAADVDVVQAVRRGIREAERNRRERS